MITIQWYIYRYVYKTYMQKQVESVVQIWKVYYFLTSVLRHEERDTTRIMLTILSDPTNVRRILLFLKISVSRDPKNPTTSILRLHRPLTILKYLFQNPQILTTDSSGHDVINTPASFPVWGLLWQWQLPYPLCGSVKPMTMHLNSKPQLFKAQPN